MPSVDNRIVEMRFDNKQFESGVSQSLGTLEKLKESLNFDKQTNKLSSLNNIGKSIDFSPIFDGVQAISDRFTTLGIIGVTALQRITNAAIDLGKHILTAIPNQIITGGKTRAMNIEQAKFQLEGLGVAWEDISNQINFGVADTAYGLDEAAKVASQLVASNVQFTKGLDPTVDGLDAMSRALRGVSGVAAMTNSSYEDIGHVFTTVAGNGRLMGDQLNQLAGRGLNVAASLTKFFNGVNDGSIEASESVKEAIRKVSTSTQLTEGDIRDFVSKGKISFEIFAEAMDNAFGEHATEANKTFTGALSNMKAALSRIGADFATPILNSGRDVFNALRNAFNRVRTFTKPIGEGKFTNFMEWITEFATTKIDNWDFQWVGNLMQAFSSLLSSAQYLLIGLDNVASAVKSAWDTMFPVSLGVTIQGIAQQVESFAKAFAEATGWVDETVQALFQVPVVGDALEQTSATLEEINDLAERVINGEFGNGEERRKAIEAEGYSYEAVQNRVNELLGDTFRFEEANDEVTESLETTGDAADVVAKRIERLGGSSAKDLNGPTTAIEKIQTIVRGIGSAVQIVGQALSAVWTNIGQPIISAFSTAAGPFIDRIVDLFDHITQLNEEWSSEDFFGNQLSKVFGGEDNKNLQNLTDTFRGLFGILDLLGQAATSVFETLFGPLLSTLPGASSGILGLTGAIGRFIAGLAESARASGFFQTTLTAVSNVITTVRDIIVKSFTSAKESILNFFSSIASGNGITIDFQSFGEVFNWLDGLVDFSSIGSSIVTVLNAIGEGLGTIFSAIPESFSGENAMSMVSTFIAGLMALSVSDVFESISSGINRLTGWGMKIKTLMTTVNNSLLALQAQLNAEAILKIAEAIAIMAASFLVMSFIDPSTLITSTGVLLLMLNSVGAVLKSLSGIKFKSGLSLNFIGSSILKMAAGLLIMSAAVAVLASIDTEGLGRGLLGITILLGEVLIFAKAMSTIDSAKSFKQVANSLTAMSIGLLIMSGVIAILGSVNVDTLKQGLAGLAIVLGEIFVFALGMDQINAGSFVATALTLGVMAAGLLALTGVVAILGHINADSLVQGLAGLAVVLGEIFVFTAAMNAAGSTLDLIGVAASLLVMAAAILVLAPALALLGQMTSDQATTALLTLAGAFMLIGLAGTFLEPVILPILGVAGAILAIGVAGLAAGVGIALIAASLTAFGASAALAATGLVTALGIFLVGIASMGTDIVLAVETLINAVLEAIVSCIPAIAAALGQTVVGLLQALITYLPVILQGIAVLLNEILMFLMDYAGPFTDNLIKILIIVINNLSVAIINNGQAIGQALSHVVASLGAFLINAIYGIFGPILDVLFPNFYSDVMSSLNGANSDLVNTITTQNGELRSAVEGNAQAMKDGWNESMSGFDPMASTDIPGSVNNTIPLLSTGGSDGANALMGSFTSTINAGSPEMQEALANLGVDSSELFSNSFDGSSAGASVVSDLMAGEQSAAPDLYGTTEEIVTTNDEYVSYADWELSGSDAILDLMTGEEIQAEELYGTTSDIATENANEFSSATEEAMQSGGESGVTAAVSGVEAQGPQFVDSMSTLAVSGATGMEDQGDSFIAAGTANVNSYGSGIRSSASYATMAADGVGSGVCSTLDNTNTYSSGRYIMSGLSNGMWANSGTVFATVESIASQIESRFNAAMQVGSPSRVFMEIGGWLMKGLSIGIDKTAREAYSSVDDLSSGVTNVMSTAISAIDDVFNDSDFNPVITPVVDMSQLKSGLTTAGRLLDQNAVFGAHSIAADISASTNYGSKLDELISTINKQASSNEKTATINNYITVSGAENPEDYANRLVRQLNMQIRMG